MNILIKDIAECERPYEKALEHGIESLSDAELLATIIRTGTREQSSIDLAHIILNNHHLHKGLSGLNYLTREELLNIKGIGNTKATQLLAIAELALRMSTQKYRKEISFDSPKSIAEYYIKKCRYINKEKTFLLLFSSAMTLIKEIPLSEGTVNMSLVSTRDVFLEALKYQAVYIILIHNHPSGNVEPSNADIKLTKKVLEAGKLLDIILSDHIIIGRDSYMSMLERGIFNEI